MSSIKLNSGKFYNFINPTTDMIDIHDITHNLSKEQRFSNCLRQNWSVLQHVLLVTDLVQYEGGDAQEQYIALHHDDPEAYLRDVPTPLKNILRDYQKFYRKCADIIAEKFKIDGDLMDLPERVKGWDRQVMLIEDVLYSPTPSDWHNFDYKGFQGLDASMDGHLHGMLKELNSVPTYKLKQVYIKRHNELKEELEL